MDATRATRSIYEATPRRIESIKNDRPHTQNYFMRNFEQENKELREENERLMMTLTIIEKAILLEKKKQAQQTQAL